jgi:hypothetical protein
VLEVLPSRQVVEENNLAKQNSALLVNRPKPSLISEKTAIKVEHLFVIQSYIEAASTFCAIVQEAFIDYSSTELPIEFPSIADFLLSSSASFNFHQLSPKAILPPHELNPETNLSISHRRKATRMFHPSRELLIR